MKSCADEIRNLVGKSSVILQDILAMEAVVLSPTIMQCTTFLSKTSNSVHYSSQISQKMIEMIKELSGLSVKVEMLNKEFQRKERESIQCMKILKQVITQQKLELESLNGAIRCETFSIGTDTDDLTSAEQARKVSKSWRKQRKWVIRTIKLYFRIVKPASY